MNFDLLDLPALHIYKIWGGQIHEIEAMGFMAPYNSPSGWEYRRQGGLAARRLRASYGPADFAARRTSSINSLR